MSLLGAWPLRLAPAALSYPHTSALVPPSPCAHRLFAPPADLYVDVDDRMATFTMLFRTVIPDL